MDYFSISTNILKSFLIIYRESITLKMCKYLNVQCTIENLINLYIGGRGKWYKIVSLKSLIKVSF